jgi:acyl carrier protein
MDEHLSRAEEGANPRRTTERIQSVFLRSVATGSLVSDFSYEQMLQEISTLDSIAVLEFVTALEKEFGVTIESELLEFEFLRDLPRLAAYLDARAGHAE